MGALPGRKEGRKEGVRKVGSSLYPHRGVPNQVAVTGMALYRRCDIQASFTGSILLAFTGHCTYGTLPLHPRIPRHWARPPREQGCQGLLLQPEGHPHQQQPGPCSLRGALSSTTSTLTAGRRGPPLAPSARQQVEEEGRPGPRLTTKMTEWLELSARQQQQPEGKGLCLTTNMIEWRSLPVSFQHCRG